MKNQKKIKRKYNVIHRSIVYDAGISNGRFGNISGVKQLTQGQIMVSPQTDSILNVTLRQWPWVEQEQS